MDIIKHLLLSEAGSKNPPEVTSMSLLYFSTCTALPSLKIILILIIPFFVSFIKFKANEMQD